jgi:hypothetical protein
MSPRLPIGVGTMYNVPLKIPAKIVNPALCLGTS